MLQPRDRVMTGVSVVALWARWVKQSGRAGSAVGVLGEGCSRNRQAGRAARGLVLGSGC